MVHLHATCDDLWREERPLSWVRLYPAGWHPLSVQVPIWFRC